jgi:hypothetical protein
MGYDKNKYKGNKIKQQTKLQYNGNVDCFDCGKDNETRVSLYKCIEAFIIIFIINS